MGQLQSFPRPIAFRLVSDQSLIGSGAAKVRRKLPNQHWRHRAGGTGYVVSPFPASPCYPPQPAPYYSTLQQPYGGDSSRSYDKQYERRGPTGASTGAVGRPAARGDSSLFVGDGAYRIDDGVGDLR